MADPGIRARETIKSRQKRGAEAGVDIDIQKEFIEAERARQRGDADGMAKIAEAMRKAGRELPAGGEEQKRAIQRMMDDVKDFGSGIAPGDRSAKARLETVEQLFDKFDTTFTPEKPAERPIARRERPMSNAPTAAVPRPPAPAPRPTDRRGRPLSDAQIAARARAAEQFRRFRREAAGYQAERLQRQNAAGAVEDVFGPRPAAVSTPNFTLTGGDLPASVDQLRQMEELQRRAAAANADQQQRQAAAGRADNIRPDPQTGFTVSDPNARVPATPQQLAVDPETLRRAMEANQRQESVGRTDQVGSRPNPNFTTVNNNPVMVDPRQAYNDSRMSRLPTAPELFPADVVFEPDRGTIRDIGQKALPPGQEVPLLTGPAPIQTSGVGPDKPGSGVAPGMKPVRSPIGNVLGFLGRNSGKLGAAGGVGALAYAGSGGEEEVIPDLANTQKPPRQDPVVDASMPTEPSFDTSNRDFADSLMRRLASGGGGRTPVATMQSVFGDNGVMPRRQLQFAGIPELPVEQQLDDTAVREAIEKARFNEVSMDDIRDPGGFFDAYIKSGNTGEDVQRAAVALARASQGRNIGEILGGVLTGYDDMVREEREGEFERRVEAEARRAQFAGKMADYEMRVQELRQKYADARTKTERDRILAENDLLNKSILEQFRANRAADEADFRAKRDQVGDINAARRADASNSRADIRTAANMATGAAGREERQEMAVRAALEQERAKQPVVNTPREFILASMYGDPKQTGVTPQQQQQVRAIYEKMSEDVEGFNVYEIPDDPVAADLYLREAINNVRSGTRNWVFGLDENEEALIRNLEAMRQQFGRMAVNRMSQ